MSLRAIILLLSILGSAGALSWHKHVVHQRDDAQAQVKLLGERLKTANAAVSESERLRGLESDAATTALLEARTDADDRVKEARRSAGAIKRIVEKPRATSVPTACPAPDIVSAGELRDALQPAPVGEAPAAEPGDVPETAAGAAPAAWSDAGPAGRGRPADGPGGDRHDVELDVGGAGVGQGPVQAAGEAVGLF